MFAEPKLVKHFPLFQDLKVWVHSTYPALLDKYEMKAWSLYVTNVLCHIIFNTTLETALNNIKSFI